jgi:hypothetical protein
MIEGIVLLDDKAPTPSGCVKAAWQQILDGHTATVSNRRQFARTPYDTQLMEPSIQIF